MASLQEIESELQAINDAIFQQLCDEYLFFSEEDFPDINRSGSQAGKRKTKKGTPDSFWRLPSGKYVFAEYTTKNREDSKSAFIEKLKEDVSKCLDENVTAVSPHQIQRLILCFNSKILPEEMEQVRSVFGENKIEIVFKSLDTIALNLFSRFPNLAYKYLGVSVNTGQVLTLKEFITEYSSGSSVTIPLDNKFLFREAELQNLKDDISISQITILAGQPGVGKSKLAVEALNQWKKENQEYEVYCLSNHDANIQDDLKSYIRPHKNYIVFIDDANRQSQNLRSILTFMKTRRSAVLKLVITVRDYALEYAKRLCQDFTLKTEVIEPLTDEQIKELLASPDFGITNPSYVNRILEIAKGNPRIAIMAARLALQHQNLNTLHDLYEFYHAYFNSFLFDHDSLNDEEVQKALGLVSFFYSIDRSDKPAYENLVQAFGLDPYKLNESFTKLEHLELVESSQDNTIIKIGDQVLSTYFFYKCFIKDRILSFSTLLYNYFPTHRNRFTDTLIPAQSDFGYEKVINPVQDVLIEYFDSISSNEEKAFEFLSSLWFCVPEHTLAYITNVIEQIPQPAKPLYKADKKNKNQTTPNDKILKLLLGYYYQLSDLLNTGLEIAFRYVEKKPELYDSLYRTLSGSFVYSYEDERYGFYRQSMLTDFLIFNTNKNHPIYLRMFFDLFPMLMESANMVHGTSWKKNAITFYKYHLPVNKHLKQIRRKIWDHATKFFQNDLPNSEEAIFKYIDPSLDFEKAVLQYDLKFVLALINKHFQPVKFIHAYYVQQFVNRFTKLSITDPTFPSLREKFYTWEYKIYKLIDTNRLRSKEEHEYENVEFDKFERLKEVEIRYKLKFDSLEQFEVFYKTYCDITLNPFIHAWNFELPLDVILDETYLRNKHLAFKFLHTIQKNQNPTFFTPFRIIKTICQNYQNDLNDLFSTIMECNYPGKPNWILTLCNLVPEENVTEAQYQALYSVYNDAEGYLYYEFQALGKFRIFNKDIFADILGIFIRKSNQGINLTLEHNFFENYAEYFHSHVDLLKQAYFICCDSKQYFDYDGEDLLIILRLDDSFLHEYIEDHTKGKYAISTREHDHLSVVWDLQNTEILVESEFDYFANNNLHHVREEFANAFFKNLSPEKAQRAKSFLFTYLKANSLNVEKANMALDVFRNSFSVDYLKAIICFIKANPSIKDFKELDLLNSFFFGSGEVNWHSLRSSELENILKEIDKLPQSSRFSQHKAYLRSEIAFENKQADSERKRKFMSDRW